MVKHINIVFIIAIMMVPLALSYTDVCENIIKIQKILLESDYDISISLHDVIVLRKRICQKTNDEKRQLLEDNQKKEFNDIFARLRNVSEESSKHLNHSLQPLHNGLSSYNKEEYIWGNWLMRYFKLFVKECFTLMFVRVE